MTPGPQENAYGVQHGQGIWEYADGRLYRGTFVRGMRSGYGIETYADGSLYEGEWRLDKFHGHGLFRWKDGRYYIGEYRKGRKYGYGELHGVQGVVKQEWAGNMSKEDAAKAVQHFKNAREQYETRKAERRASWRHAFEGMTSAMYNATVELQRETQARTGYSDPLMTATPEFSENGGRPESRASLAAKREYEEGVRRSSEARKKTLASIERARQSAATSSTQLEKRQYVTPRVAAPDVVVPGSNMESHSDPRGRSEPADRIEGRDSGLASKNPRKPKRYLRLEAAAICWENPIGKKRGDPKRWNCDGPIQKTLTTDTIESSLSAVGCKKPGIAMGVNGGGTLYTCDAPLKPWDRDIFKNPEYKLSGYVGGRETFACTHESDDSDCVIDSSHARQTRGYTVD